MTLTDHFNAALTFASRLHQRQRRKGTDIPYLAHLLAVTSIALEYGADEEEAIAALLHDAVEDQGGEETSVEIRKRFGDRVAEIVLACSDTLESPKPSWNVRKERYITHLAEASPGALLVSAADKLHNARSILADFRRHGEAVFSRFNAGREGTLWYYRELVNAFRATGDAHRSAGRCVGPRGQRTGRACGITQHHVLVPHRYCQQISLEAWIDRRKSDRIYFGRGIILLTK
ncbi:MAG: HD domain-containing protein [Armatimonadota bacterium]